MKNILGIRREDKNQWERRVPLTPEHIKELKEKHNIQTIIQPSTIRIFSNEEYQKNHATIKENLTDCSVIFAVKEIPIDFFEPSKTYVFFSHTIKGQKYNMPMLKKMMELGCNLIDYEKIADENNHRLVFFGRYAGLAGMVDTLWTYGQRLKWMEIDNSLSEIKRAIDYKNLDEIKEHLKKIGGKIEQNGFHESLTPMVVGLAGYGNVSQGAQEILDMLPVKEVGPRQLEAVYNNPSNKVIYKVVFKEKDIVEPVSSEKQFDLQDYYDNPHFYRSIFHQYLNLLSILMNCMYWDNRYPRLITKKQFGEIYTRLQKLQVIGDISVDINGAIEFTEKTTNPGEPVFVYNPVRDDIIEGFAGEGIAVMAVDTLPCEIPFESSQAFSKSLMPFIPNIMNADFSYKFDALNLSPEIKKAVILHQGRLTPVYEYINKFL